MTALTDVNLQEYLKRGNAQCWDMDRLINYVRRILPQAIHRQETGDDADFNSEKGPTRFNEKVCTLIDPIIDRGLAKEALQLLILYKTLLRKPGPRWEYGCRVQHSHLDTKIEQYIGTKGSLNSKHSSHVNSNSECSLRRTVCDGPLWHSDPYVRNTSRYWDLSDAARTLGTVYMSEECGPKPRRSECFRTVSIKLLDVIQKKAWSEVRHNVFVTLGSVFPAELTETIFGFCLNAEEIPSNPGTRETHFRPTPSWIRRKCYQERKQWSSHVGYDGAKDMYTCCHIKYKERRSKDVFE